MCLYMEDASYQPQSSSESTIFCDCTWKTWCCSIEQRYYCDLDWWILLMKYLKISLVLILIFFSNLYYEVHIRKAIFFIILIVTLSNFILDVGSSYSLCDSSIEAFIDVLCCVKVEYSKERTNLHLADELHTVLLRFYSWQLV